MSLKQGSRYILADIVEDKIPVLGTLRRPRFLNLRQRQTGERVDDRVIDIKGHHTWAGLALFTLGDANAWWAIADLSGVVDPFEELASVGDKLRIPSRERYFMDMQSGENPVNGR